MSDKPPKRNRPQDGRGDGTPRSTDEQTQVPQEEELTHNTGSKAKREPRDKSDRPARDK